MRGSLIRLGAQDEVWRSARLEWPSIIRAMRIALLTDSIEADAPGFASYATNLARALIQLRPADVTLIHRAEHPFYAELPDVIPALGGSPLPARIRRQWSLPHWLDAQGFELVHDTYHFGPFLRASRFARVLTIGDLTPLVSVGADLTARLAHRLLLPLIARRADRIVTFSDNSRRDIERLLRIPAARIIVTPLAAGDVFRANEADVIEAARSRLGLPERYLLFVGSIEPRKNLPALVRAFADAREQLGGVKLLLVGRRSWGSESLLSLARELDVAERVVIRRDIGNSDLPLVYGGAIALVFPSLYEGFGLPPLEAMQCGTPVVTSNTSSLPEVVGDAAVLVDPRSVESITSGVVEIATNDGLRRQLRERGLERARRFGWRRCAELTLSAYDAAMGDHAAR
jgi:glycosyltransferase involved in cell wall biosynthesis